MIKCAWFQVHKHQNWGNGSIHAIHRRLDLGSFQWRCLPIYVSIIISIYHLHMISNCVQHRRGLM